MTTPAAVRVPGAGHEGLATPASGVVALRRALSAQGSLDSFRRWANDPMTRLVLSAIRDLSVFGPPGVDESGIAVQYGMTAGLNLAAQLIDDPSVVYPELFTGVMSEGVRIPDENYTTSVGVLLDGQTAT